MRSIAARLHRAKARRRGASLILFAMLVFVVLAMAGLVIDVGVAHLAQAQMQTAVDTAALEGCRWRNYDEYLTSSDSGRRREVSELVRLVFDDDLDPTRGGYQPETGPLSVPDGPDAYAFAAGPRLKVTGGDAGNLGVHAQVGELAPSVAAAVDDPILQRNPRNKIHGDQVTGRFVPAPYATGTGSPESGAYVRQDFVPAPSPLTSAEVYHALSFLVRMRRSAQMNPDGAPTIAEDVETNTSSSLPRLPLLFSMGSTLRQAAGETWNPRIDGLTVRATAIASAMPALRIAPPVRHPDGTPVMDHSTSIPQPMAGTLPFAVNLDSWISIAAAAWHNATAGQMTVQSDGTLLWGGSVVGRFAENLHSVGNAIVPLSAPFPAFASASQKPSYVAIYSTIPNASGVPVERVIGYGFGRAAFSGGSTFQLSVGENLTFGIANCWIAQDNASAHLDDFSARDLSAAEWNAVLSETFRLAYPGGGGQPSFDYTQVRPGTVLAPVLTR